MNKGGYRKHEGVSLTDFIELERKKALDFLREDPHVTLTPIREAVRVDKEKLEGENERKKETVVKEIVNPRLRTEAYLKKIGKL